MVKASHNISRRGLGGRFRVSIVGVWGASWAHSSGGNPRAAWNLFRKGTAPYPWGWLSLFCINLRDWVLKTLNWWTVSAKELAEILGNPSDMLILFLQNPSGPSLWFYQKVRRSFLPALRCEALVNTILIRLEGSARGFRSFEARLSCAQKEIRTFIIFIQIVGAHEVKTHEKHMNYTWDMTRLSLGFSSWSFRKQLKSFFVQKRRANSLNLGQSRWPE